MRFNMLLHIMDRADHELITRRKAGPVGLSRLPRQFQRLGTLVIKSGLGHGELPPASQLPFTHSSGNGKELNDAMMLVDDGNDGWTPI